MWTFIFVVSAIWFALWAQNFNRSADQKLQDFTNRLQAQHDERVNFWTYELDSARMPEYREYCQQQIDQWYWTSPVGQQELIRLRAEAAHRIALDPEVKKLITTK
jgi:hypothetical protein